MYVLHDFFVMGWEFVEFRWVNTDLDYLYLWDYMGFDDVWMGLCWCVSR